MSHDHGRRAAGGITILNLWFHFDNASIARGVTAMVVGSGALLGFFFIWRKRELGLENRGTPTEFL